MKETQHTWHAEEAFHGKRLDQYLASVGAPFHLSRSRMQRLIADGHVTLNGAVTHADAYKLRTGDQIVVTVPEATEAIPQAQAIPLEIVHEDAHLIVLNKPAGLVVHPGAGNADHTLVNALIAHCGDDLSGIGGVKRPGIIHRLDKDTSGLMLVAKTDQAHHGLSDQFASHSLTRRYLALIWGVPKDRSGTIETLLGRSPHNRQKMAILRHGGKNAVTHYKVLEIFYPHATLIQCQLETGRTHQIRVHMASIGHTIIGDKIYGKVPKAVAHFAQHIHRQALHSASLDFIHPATKEPLSFECALPDDLNQLLTAIKEHK